MQLSSRWLLVIPHPICYNDLAISYKFKERLLKCDLIDLGLFVDLRERHLNYWAPYCDMHQQERNSKHSTYHQWRNLPSKRALVMHSPCILPRYCIYDGDHVTCFLSFLLTLYVAWHAKNSNSDLGSQYLPYLWRAMLMTYKMSSTSFYTTHPHMLSLHRTHASLFHSAGIWRFCNAKWSSLLTFT